MQYSNSKSSSYFHAATAVSAGRASLQVQIVPWGISVLDKNHLIFKASYLLYYYSAGHYDYRKAILFPIIILIKKLFHYYFFSW